MMNIGELCVRNTFIIRQDENIAEAAKLMRVFNVGDLIVVAQAKEGNRPVGILTDRDIVMRVVADERDPKSVKVADIMGKEVVTGSEEDGIYESIERMRTQGVRRLPVVDEKGYLAGILSVDDILEFLGEEVSSLIGLVYREQGLKPKGAGSDEK